MAAPNMEQSYLVLGVLSQFDGIIGGFDRVTVDFQDDVAGLEAGFGRGGVGGDLGDDGAL